jgi:recombination protein RecA
MRRDLTLLIQGGSIGYSRRRKGEYMPLSASSASRSSRADLESLLRSRKLDRTLTTSLPPIEDDAAASDITALDARLGGGFPRGHVSELVGSRSSGRTSVLLRMLAAATARGELVALVDALDMFDVDSAAAAGIDLDRLLWIRGHVVTNPGMCRDMNQRALEQALRAFTLVLQAGKFGVVAFDVAEAPSQAIRRLPFTTWLRLQRIVEGSQTVCVLVGSEPMARSSAGLTLRVGIRDSGLGIRFGSQLFEGFDVEGSIVRARIPNESRIPNPESHVRLSLSTACA